MIGFFKKGIGLITLLLFSAGVSAQVDSADFDFYTGEAVLANSEDSMQYSGAGYIGLYLDFAMADIVPVYKMWVEVIQYDLENNVSSIYINSFTQGQLASAGYVTANQAIIPLAMGYNTYNYQLVLRLEDAQGHESAIITKTLVP